jgi:hypothetical protein
MIKSGEVIVVKSILFKEHEDVEEYMGDHDMGH